MQKNIDSFNIEDIKNIYENENINIKKGETGIEDLGNLNSNEGEGYCLKFNIKDQNNSIYIICFDSLSEKTKIKNLGRDLKIQNQHKNGIYLIEEGQKSPQNNEQNNESISISSLISHKSKKTKDCNEKPKKPIDGYWIILQNWSQCSLKCGGGISTLHRMCIPQKRGGKPCEGKAILTKECNNQPCPNVYGTSENLNLENKRNTEVMKPIVKIMPFTNNPQRYTLCKIKESDLMINFSADDPNLLSSNLLENRKLEPGIKEITIPSRVIMNNSTLSVFTGEHYETLFLTFILKKSLFYINSNSFKKGCFIIKQNKQSITLCPFGCERDDSLQKEWQRDFNLFRNKCGRSLPYKIEEDEELKKKIQEKMVIKYYNKI
jgi:hypothetical protein